MAENHKLRTLDRRLDPPSDAEAVTRALEPALFTNGGWACGRPGATSGTLGRSVSIFEILRGDLATLFPIERNARMFKS